jgi:hypothetical protein
MIGSSEYLRFDHVFHVDVTFLMNIELSEWLSDKVETALAMNGTRVERYLHAVKRCVYFRVTVGQHKLGATNVVEAKESRNCCGPNPLKHPLAFRRDIQCVLVRGLAHGGVGVSHGVSH